MTGPDFRKPRAPTPVKAGDYCFVVMPYAREYKPVFRELQTLIRRETGLLSGRADHMTEPGVDLLDKVHRCILEASVVVVDVSMKRVNVYYEYGYATAHDRVPILIARKGTILPTDLKGKELLEYSRPLSADADFVAKLRGRILSLQHSPIPEQRRMLEAASPTPAYVLAAPRVPGRGSKHWWHPDERSAFAELFGVSRILNFYGSRYGGIERPEYLHAGYVPDDVYSTPANFFCFGSPKVNPATARFLDRLQAGLNPRWRLLHRGRGPDAAVMFEGPPRLARRMNLPMRRRRDGSTTDVGLIVRGPFPGSNGHVVLIVAGRHSPGTHAACLAATSPPLIREIASLLARRGIDIRDTIRPFWVAVKGTLSAAGHMREQDVKVLAAGGYRRHRS